MSTQFLLSHCLLADLPYGRFLLFRTSRGFHRSRLPANQREGLANPAQQRNLTVRTTSFELHLPAKHSLYHHSPLLHSWSLWLSCLLPPSFNSFHWRVFVFFFFVSMLARTVLRSVPSRGLARQLLNRPSTVSTPPPLCQLRTSGNGSIALQWV